ncbi:MAG: hypothetical protein AAF668_03310 [Pseudomonadota bacterium]
METERLGEARLPNPRLSKEAQQTNDPTPLNAATLNERMAYSKVEGLPLYDFIGTREQRGVTNFIVVGAGTSEVQNQKRPRELPNG